MNNSKFLFAMFATGVVLSLGLLSSAVIWHRANQTPQTYGNRADGATSISCNNLTQSIVQVGKDVSVSVLATSSRRSWARIGIPTNASTTFLLSVANGATTTAGNGTILLNNPNVTGASSSPTIDFGLNTAFPYTGTVQALSLYGSSTLVVTQCSYNP